MGDHRITSSDTGPHHSLYIDKVVESFFLCFFSSRVTPSTITVDFFLLMCTIFFFNYTRSVWAIQNDPAYALIIYIYMYITHFSLIFRVGRRCEGMPKTLSPTPRTCPKQTLNQMLDSCSPAHALRKTQY